MQRAEVLLQKLNEQILSNASASHILVTLQLLQREYLRKAETELPIDSTVSVLMPNTISDAAQLADKEIEQILDMVKEDESPLPSGTNHFNEVVVDISIDSDPVVEPHSFNIEAFQEEEKSALEALKEINDKLKSESGEIVEFLVDVPIRELKKAIGINDRYLFINELFNGDEAMFDRSLKTLDQFISLQDAESWIRRELSVKIGWKEDNPVVGQFTQLLKRRFS